MYTRAFSTLILWGLLAFSALANGEPFDNLLLRKWDISLLEAQSHPKTEGCDSAFHIYWNKYFYYDSDTLFYHIATRPLEDIVEEVFYYYDLMAACSEKMPAEREKLLTAIHRYHSKDLVRELDVFDTYYRWNISQGISKKQWDFIWQLSEKYEKQGDLQTKLRILYHLLWGCSGFPTYLAGKNMKERVPLIQLINETLATLDRLDKPYIMSGGAIYQHIACIYYDFKFYDKAIPLFRKALDWPTGYYFDRTSMKARDYLGAYYSSMGDYERSDSLYLAIINSPETMLLRPVDDVIALGALGKNARLQRNNEKAFSYYSHALPLCLQFKDSTLAGSFALCLGQIHLERNETEQAFKMMEAARYYTIAGNQRYRNWEEYYTLCRNYYLKTHQLDRAAAYIDSVTTFQAVIHNDYDAHILAYAEQELYEKEAVLKEEQLQMSKTRFQWLALILALSVMTVGILFYSNRLKHEKNKQLVHQIREQDILAAEMELQQDKLRKYRNLFIEQNNHLSEENETKNELLERLIILMKDPRNFTEPEINRKILAEKLNTNENYLRETIKEHFGNTIGEYITGLRLNYARELLAQNEKYTIEAVAFDVGLGSRSTFQRLFHKQFGLSPNDYRKLLNEKG